MVMYVLGASPSGLSVGPEIKGSGVQGSIPAVLVMCKINLGKL